MFNYLKKFKSSGRSIGENEFRGYPKSELEREKENLLQNVSDNPSTYITLFDWKYMEKNCFITYNKKIKTDVIKQLCYDFSLKKLGLNTEQNLFAISTFEASSFINIEDLYQNLKNNDVSVFKLNFPEIQQIYLTHD